MEDAIKPDPRTGKPHYPERNWEKGLPIHTMIDSALRHLAKYVDGWDDEDHLCAAATNLLMAMWTEERLPQMQDIPSRSHKRAFPGTSGIEGPLTPALDAKAKEEATEGQEDTCRYEYPAGCAVATVPPYKRMNANGES